MLTEPQFRDSTDISRFHVSRSTRASASLSRILLASFCACLLSFGLTSRAQAGTLVTINTNMGNIQLDLYGDIATTTVNNFLGYVTGSDYTNTIIHRSVNDFVIQGGGFDLSGSAIATNGTIPLEYRMLNKRGTIAMARTSDPNSASSQWFINTADNTTILAPKTGSDGYAVFGWVVSGMDVVDAIAALPTFAYSSPFGEIPLQNYTQAQFNANVPVTDANKVIINSVTFDETHPSYQNPVSHYDVNNDGSLTTVDLMSIVNAMLAHGRSFAATQAGVGNQYLYYDIDGNNTVNTRDLMSVVNAILLARSQSASPLASPMNASLAVVPEPTSVVLAISAALAFLAVAARRRRRRLAA